mgnify:CR=1 FL=1
MKKILVVDNHPVILEFMSKILSRAGYEVVTAQDGLSALDLMQTHTPDVMFIDLVMPNIDGKKLCQVYVPPEGALTIVRELGGKGFILAIDPPTLTEAEAEDFLRVLAAEGGFTWTQ